MLEKYRTVYIGTEAEIVEKKSRMCYTNISKKIEFFCAFVRKLPFYCIRRRFHVPVHLRDRQEFSR